MVQLKGGRRLFTKVESALENKYHFTRVTGNYREMFTREACK
jgi:hypothetical protein